MSKSLFNLLWDKKRELLLQIMTFPLGSPERYVYREDIRAIERRLATAIVSV
jgi:hypothetical protein